MHATYRNTRPGYSSACHPAVDDIDTLLLVVVAAAAAVGTLVAVVDFVAARDYAPLAHRTRTVTDHTLPDRTG